MPDRTPCVGGNWKMNTRAADAGALAKSVADGAASVPGVEVVLFPPAVYLQEVAGVLSGTSVALGGQDASEQSDGAWTGQISAGMLRDVGCTHLLVGHSERRHGLGEQDALLNAKLQAGLEAGLDVMLCIGESLQERQADRTADVVVEQVQADLANVPVEALSSLTIAYEPVWAIGTGLTASPEDAQAVHALVRQTIGSLYDGTSASAMRILYGGSVKPGNAADLFAQVDIDGGLIGGASLDAEQFQAIVEAAGQSCCRS